MGGTPDFIALPGELSQEEVRTKHDEAVRECQYNSGHGGYTGTLAEKIDGVEFPTLPSRLNGVLPSRHAAEQWVLEHNEKWGPSFAVRCTGEDGKEWWIVGGGCSS